MVSTKKNISVAFTPQRASNSSFVLNAFSLGIRALRNTEGGVASLQSRRLFVQQSPSLPTQSRSEPGAATQNQWDATSATARTELELDFCTLCTQWPVGWPATCMPKVCT